MNRAPTAAPPSSATLAPPTTQGNRLGVGGESELAREAPVVDFFADASRKLPEPRGASKGPLADPGVTTGSGRTAVGTCGSPEIAEADSTSSRVVPGPGSC